MKFVAHNHYNNNSDRIGRDLESPRGAFSLTESSVRISTQGVVIINLRREHNPAEKLELFRELDRRLTEEFGHGFSLVSSADSDCCLPDELPAFYDAVKTINPEVQTLWSGAHYNRTPKNADIQSLSNVKMAELVEMAGVTEADKAEPKECWRELSYKLEDMYDEAADVAVKRVAEAKAAARPSARRLG